MLCFARTYIDPKSPSPVSAQWKTRILDRWNPIHPHSPEMGHRAMGMVKARFMSLTAHPFETLAAARVLLGMCVDFARLSIWWVRFLPRSHLRRRELQEFDERSTQAKGTKYMRVKCSASSIPVR